MSTHGDEDVNFHLKRRAAAAQNQVIKRPIIGSVSSFDWVACPALVSRTGSSSSLGLIVFAVLSFH
jgi:hypothetical protein